MKINNFKSTILNKTIIIIYLFLPIITLLKVTVKQTTEQIESKIKSQ